jgi:hypothetical protein
LCQVFTVSKLPINLLIERHQRAKMLPALPQGRAAGIVEILVLA